MVMRLLHSKKDILNSQSVLKVNSMHHAIFISILLQAEQRLVVTTQTTITVRYLLLQLTLTL